MTVNERFQPSSMDLIRAGLQDLEASRRLFEQLKANGIPEDRLQAVLDSLTNACDPDTALTNLVAIVNAATSRGEALSGIIPDRQSFERMITVLGVSDAMGKLMRFHPDLVQAASSDVDNTYLYNHAQRRTSMLQAIGADPDELDAPVAGLELADAATALRGTYYRQLAAIMAQDATAPDPCIIQPTISRELSDLADSALEGALAIARHEVEGSDHVRFVIIGMGKLGAQELNYVSDVDLIYAVEPADDAIGNQELIRDLITLQYSTNPYSVDTLSLILGSAAMEEEAYYRKNAEIIQENRKYTAETLTSMGFEVLPSKANFVFARRPGTDGDKLYRKLKEKGVLVRHFTTERIQDYVRITIGTKEQMDVLFEKLREILQEE